MSDAADKRLKAQLDAQAAQIQQLQMRLAANNARRTDDDDDELPAFQQPQQQPAQNYQQVDPNQLILQAITTQAARVAAKDVKDSISKEGDETSRIKSRMERLVKDYPALQQEDSALVVKARDIYARIAKENQSLDEATRYELAVREAASVVGARPMSLSAEDYATNSDWTMPTNSARNPALPSRATKSRLTPSIIMNAKLMGINVDANTPDGKKNLAELSDYSSRFNADVNEDQFRYQ